MTNPIRITVEHPRRCLTCEEQIAFGEEAWWLQDVGIWHVDCEAPSNLETYRREAQRKRELGL